MIDEDRYDFILESENPEAVLAVLHQLSGLRSQYIVGQKLAQKYPTEAAWLEALKSQVVQESVAEFAQCVADIRTAIELAAVADPETLQKAVSQHYSRALGGIKELSELVEVDGEELLSVLIQA